MMRLALHWQILITMVLGAVLGIALNRGAGNAEARDVQLDGGSTQPLGMTSSVDLPQGAAWIEDTTDQILIQIYAQRVGRRLIVRGPVALPV